jgi:hypothetical protein
LRLFLKLSERGEGIGVFERERGKDLKLKDLSRFDARGAKMESLNGFLDIFSISPF